MEKFYENFGKFMIILLIGGAIGGTAFYIGQKYSSNSGKTSTEKKEVKKSAVENKVPANENENVEEMIVEKDEKGTIKGTLGYPAGGIPPLEVYAISSTDNSKFFFIKTEPNQSSFEIDEVDPGKYFVLAYKSNFAGGWTKAVPCGLSVDCNDHSLIEVEVTAGKTTSGVEIKDWYAPENFFPSKPN